MFYENFSSNPVVSSEGIVKVIRSIDLQVKSRPLKRRSVVGLFSCAKPVLENEKKFVARILESPMFQLDANNMGI